jgi:hypothetical protein
MTVDENYAANTDLNLWRWERRRRLTASEGGRGI